VRVRRRRWPWLLALLVTLSVAGLVVAQTHNAEAPIDPALVVTAKRGTLSIDVLETGRVEPREKVELKSKLAGQVLAVRVDEGDRVRRGDLLILLDPTDYEREVAAAEAELAKAEAAIDFARLNLARKRRGVAEQIVPRAELDDAEHDLRARSADARLLSVRLRTARDRVGYTQIASPIDGTVIQRGTEVGEVVVPGVQATFEGRPLLTVADLSTLLVKVELNQIDVAKIQLGNAASVTFDALPGKTYAAKVTRVAPASSKISGKDVEVFLVEAELLATDAVIKPGMTADVRIHLEARADVIMLPIEAVITSGERSRVTRVLTDPQGKQRSETIEVTLGARNDSELELLSGLSEGDRVLLDPASASANELKL
jgi:membrane fusion protein, macrolide-specific efflux system